MSTKSLSYGCIVAKCQSSLSYGLSSRTSTQSFTEPLLEDSWALVTQLYNKSTYNLLRGLRGRRGLISTVIIRVRSTLSLQVARNLHTRSRCSGFLEALQICWLL